MKLLFIHIQIIATIQFQNFVRNVYYMGKRILNMFDRAETELNCFGFRVG